jgi:restriction endonuclease S subunit
MAKKSVPAASKASKTAFETVKLSDVADLLRLPPGVKDEQLKKGGKKVKSISITDIPAAGYIEDVVSTITLPAEKFKSLKKYVIQPYDVVMSIQGTVGTVGVVPAEFPGSWMANISLLVIRFRENAAENSVALTMFLKSAHGREIIARLQKGDAIKRINVKEFAAVQVPVLTADVKKLSTAVFKEEIELKARVDDLHESIRQVRAGYLAG